MPQRAAIDWTFPITVAQMVELDGRKEESSHQMLFCNRLD